MPKRGPRTPDENQVAHRTVKAILAKHDPEAADAPTVRPPKDPAAVARGKKGGEKGGAARAAKLTPVERSAIAKRAADSRWK